MAGRQVDFPEKQRHSRTTELTLWIISVLCVAFVLIAIFAVSGGEL